MKACNGCGKRKPLAQFHSTHHRCKQCRRDEDRARYERGMKWLAEYLLEHPCVDCGETDLDLLEFDHREMLRSSRGRISQFTVRGPEVLAHEVAKCEVRCSNCHNRRTRDQMGARSRYEWLGVVDVRPQNRTPLEESSRAA